jgi:serpin B
MYQNETFSYAENKNLKIQIGHLPYKSDNYDVEFVLTVILPNKGVRLEEVEQRLTSDSQLMKQVLSFEGTTSKELLLYLPKFKMESSFQLNDVLIELGMKSAFYGEIADFTGIAGEGLYISKVKISLSFDKLIIISL